MKAEDLLDQLGYANSKHFLRAGSPKLSRVPYYGHIFRHAEKHLPQRTGRSAEFLGVYNLSPQGISPSATPIPLLYVCRADTQEAANQVHRLVWCQDIVPFILVHTPNGIVFRSGFRFERSSAQSGGILAPLRAFNECQDLLESISSEQIDSGGFWQRWRPAVTPEKRVDWKLLDNLQRLDQRLSQMGLPRDTSHALIGKYVFLHYLRHRDILSNRKLASWGLGEEDVFGRTVTVKGLKC